MIRLAKLTLRNQHLNFGWADLFRRVFKGDWAFFGDGYLMCERHWIPGRFSNAGYKDREDHIAKY
jgi:hypothetical protein